MALPCMECEAKSRRVIFIESHAGSIQVNGWVDAWQSASWGQQLS